HAAVSGEQVGCGDLVAQRVCLCAGDTFPPSAHDILRGLVCLFRCLHMTWRPGVTQRSAVAPPESDYTLISRADQWRRRLSLWSCVGMIPGAALSRPQQQWARLHEGGAHILRELLI